MGSLNLQVFHHSKLLLRPLAPTKMSYSLFQSSSIPSATDPFPPQDDGCKTTHLNSLSHLAIQAQQPCSSQPVPPYAPISHSGRALSNKLLLDYSAPQLFQSTPNTSSRPSQQALSHHSNRNKEHTPFVPSYTYPHCSS